jgi:hypothetical protein
MIRLRISKAGIVVAILAALFNASESLAQNIATSAPFLGTAPKAPVNFTPPSGGVPRKLDITGGLSVNSNSREQTREFYNAIYPASEGVAMNSSAVIADCDPGTNGGAYLDATLLRINWFRAMGGIPASITFSSAENPEDQSAALIMSANNQLAHTGIPETWSCFSTSGTNAAANSDLALGVDGPDAITGYIWDYGSANWEAGHRRWILYPQTQTMADGDVPSQGTYAAANGVWILDSNYGGPRPTTAAPFVSWPPPGYAPYPVVFPQWSFALSNADPATATVTMLSNGVPLNIKIQPFAPGYGENTIVWYPTNLDWTSYNTTFPFNGSDTVYDITVSNVQTSAGYQSFSYSVTVFDPSIRGADYVPTIIKGTNRPSVNGNNLYSCTQSPNPGITGYQWVTAQLTNGNLADNATNGLTNFTISPPPLYSVITNPPVGSGSCFHLTHTNPVPQLLEFKETLFPATNTSLSFQGLLGYATTNEVARVQVSTNGGGAWLNLYTQTGTGGSGETAFATHNLSLSNYAGCVTSVRFDYDYGEGAYYPQVTPNVGWSLEHIVVTNASQLVSIATNNTASTNYNFMPTQTGSWVLETRGVLFSQFGVDWSPSREVTAITNTAPVSILLGSMGIAANQAQIPFTVTGGPVSTFQLLQSGQITGVWQTNSSAVLTTLVPGSSYQFTAAVGGATMFYRVLGR